VIKKGLIGIGGLLALLLRAPAAAEPTTSAPASKTLIQIGVEVVEVDEQKAKNLGIQWLNVLHISESSVPSLLTVGTLSRDAIFADLKFLETHGAADLLANPKLVARDATDASFHAGGELPYATAGTLGTVTVEFKPYGVDLKINPHLNAQGRIDMSVDAEVSGPDSQNGVTLSGNVVPAIRSRKVSSQLTLAPGSTLTMAGLIQSDKEWIRDGVPGLMHVPLLKYLFSHKVETLRKTSIVVFVTPTILEEPKAFSGAAVSESDDLLRIENEKDMGGTPSHG
jgi:pilus assembly protein CpaC